MTRRLSFIARNSQNLFCLEMPPLVSSFHEAMALLFCHFIFTGFRKRKIPPTS